MQVQQCFTMIFTQLFYFAYFLTDAIPTPVRLRNSDHYVQIGDREPYNAHLTSLSFAKPMCVVALEVQTLQPLTGAEDIELSYSICDESSKTANSSWNLAHYTNKKDIFVLRKPILTRRLAIIAGVRRGTTAAELLVLNVNIKQCDSDNVFGPEEIGKLISRSKSICPSSITPSKHHTHRHRHNNANDIFKVNDIGLDPLQPSHSPSAGFGFKRSKRLVFTDLTPNKVLFKVKRQANLIVGEECSHGYTGPACTEIDCQGVQNCSNSGVCVAPNTCKCAANYFGADCSLCSGWFCNQCDFYCVHGQCDAITRSCTCQPGWSGAACDVCIDITNCEVFPIVKFILPQTAETNNQNDYVFVHGIDFPQGDGHYHCLFGGISTAGNWLNSDLLRCTVPQKARPGKHVFNVIPFGATNYLPNNQGKVQHFTFYSPCDPEVCRGSCFGPLCMCNSTAFGNDCNTFIPAPAKKVEILTDLSITFAQEGEAYVISIPIDATSRVAQIDAEIASELIVDPFKHTLTWEKPRGRSNPYEIAVTIVNDAMDVQIRWNLSVSPSYNVISGKLKQQLSSNGWLLRGVVESINGSWVSSNVPIKLEISSSKHPDVVFDTINTISFNSTSFQRQMYPYAGTSTTSETYIIKARHPSQLEDIMINSATWKYKKLQITSLSGKNITINDGSHSTAFFMTNSLDLNCQTFEVFVFTPMAIVQLTAWSFLKENADCIEANFTIAADGTPNRTLRSPVDAVIGFKCGKSLGATVKVRFNPFLTADNIIKTFPESLFLYSNQLTTLKLIFLDVKTEIQQGLVTAANIFPFYVVESSPQNYGNANAYQNGSILKLTLGVLSSAQTSTNSGVLKLPTAAESLVEIPYSIRPPAIETLELTIMPLGFVASQPAKKYPLELALYSVNNAVSMKRIVHLNARSEFYQLPPDFYRISIRSLTFQSFDTIHHLRSENNTLTVFLHRKPTNLVVTNGQEVTIETFSDSLSNSTIEPVAEIVFYPSSFTASDLDKEIYVNVVYTRGPYNSTAYIDFDKVFIQTAQFHLIAIDNEGETLCVGCGLRQRIRILKNPSFVNLDDSDCSVFRGSVPFRYIVDGVAIDFEGEVTYIIDLRKTRYEGIKMCQSNPSPSPIPEVTTVLFDCAVARLDECRSYYVHVQSCGNAWNQIPDGVLSIHVYGLFLKMQQTCTTSGISFQQFATLIDCIKTFDADCPVIRPFLTTESSAPVTPSPFVSMLNQINAIKPLTQSLSEFFPALFTVESQLVNLPSQMGDFIDEFQQVFPTFTPSESFTDWFDVFWRAVDNNSPGGQTIVPSEAAKLVNWAEGEIIITRWNEINKLMTGESLNLLKNSKVNAFKRLIENADRLKSLARQLGAANPFEMLYEVQTRLFSRTVYPLNASEPVARVLGVVEPGSLREKNEFDVSVVITNVMKSTIQNIKLQLETLEVSKNQSNLNRITYRIGPLFYSGGTPDQLAPGKTLTASWKVQPIFEQRLSKAVIIKPNVIIVLDLTNRQKIQRLSVPSITIKPQRHLRIFALAYPTLISQSQSQSEARPFSLAFYVMNSGFSDLRNIRFPLLTPHLVKANDGQPVEFRIDAVAVDEKFVGFTPDVVIPLLPSGRSIVISMNMSTFENEIAKFVNCTVAATIDNDLPDFFDYRFYLIKEAVNRDGYVLSVGDPLDDQLVTYYFNTKSTKISSLHNVQLVEKTESYESTPDGTTSLVVTATFLRLLDQIQLNELANLQSLKEMTSTIIGKIHYPEESMPTNYELVRLTEISLNMERRHSVPLEKTWVKEAGETKELNFIDEKALPPALALQLHYEFVFGRCAEFNAPFFLQNTYSIQIYPEMIPEDYVVVGKGNAVSPIGQKLEYDLIGMDENAIKAFAIGQKTGDIILTNSQLLVSHPSKSIICFNIIAKDENGQQTVAPLLIQLPVNGINATPNTYCNVFSPSALVKHHQYNESRSKLKPMQFAVIPSATKVTEVKSLMQNLTNVIKNLEYEITKKRVLATAINKKPTENNSNVRSTTFTTNDVLLMATTPIYEPASSIDLRKEKSLPTQSTDSSTDPPLIVQTASKATDLNKVKGLQLITPMSNLTESEATDLKSWEKSSEWHSNLEGVILPKYPDNRESHSYEAYKLSTTSTTLLKVSLPEHVIINGYKMTVKSFPSSRSGIIDIKNSQKNYTTEATPMIKNNDIDSTLVDSIVETTSWQTSKKFGLTETLFLSMATASTMPKIPSTLITYNDILSQNQMIDVASVEVSSPFPQSTLNTINKLTTVEGFSLPPSISKTQTFTTQNLPTNQLSPTHFNILLQPSSSPPISTLSTKDNSISTESVLLNIMPTQTQSLSITLDDNVENRGTNIAAKGSISSDMGMIQTYNNNDMTEIACRLQKTKPIWAIICDMSKTVGISGS